ncbi:phage tail domain-containing protein, partial [Streptococcus pyogenes]
QEDDIPYLIEDLANFLDIGETTIRFADSKDRSWKVVFEGASEINQSLNVGDFTLNFRCIEVTSYGEEVTGKVTMDTDEGTFFQIFNEGTA